MALLVVLGIILMALTTLLDQVNGQSCAEFEVTGHFCVPEQQCIQGVIDTSGSALLTIRTADLPTHQPNREALNSFCPTGRDGGQQVCCYSEEEGQKLQEEQQQRQQQERQRLQQEEQDAVNSELTRERTCGVHNVDGLRGFKSGKAGHADFAEYPHVCAVLSRKVVGNNRGYQYEGVASLITWDTLLTAAHVIQDLTVSEIEIRCGQWRSSRQGGPPPLLHQARGAASTAIHPDYNQRTKYNNFGLIFVSEDFREEPHVHPVCLPEPDMEDDWSLCVGNGWGKFNVTSKVARVMKEVELPLVDSGDCESRLRATVLGRFFKLHPSFICAGGEEGKDLCERDGGGPLACKSKKDGSLYQLGVTSLGLGCNQAIPAIYANVRKAVCWIDAQVSCRSCGSLACYTRGQLRRGTGAVAVGQVGARRSRRQTDEDAAVQSYFGFTACPVSQAACPAVVR